MSGEQLRVSDWLNLKDSESSNLSSSVKPSQSLTNLVSAAKDVADENHDISEFIEEGGMPSSVKKTLLLSLSKIENDIKDYDSALLSISTEIEDLHKPIDDQEARLPNYSQDRETARDIEDEIKELTDELNADSRYLNLQSRHKTFSEERSHALVECDELQKFLDFFDKE